MSVRTAVVYSEAFFGTQDGKTANGLVRFSEKYEILAVIDSTKAGLDAGEYLDDQPNGIPICADLAAVILLCGRVPDFFIIGVAPLSGMLSASERAVVLDAMGRGMSIVNGLHEFLNDDLEFTAAAATFGVRLLDVRRPRAKKDLRMFSGRIDGVTCPRIAVLGTDGAIGKRTTATILTGALNDRGIRAVLVGTGQTGLIQGARYGVALDAIPCQFCSGEMEAAVVDAFEAEHPDVIVIEGQGALSHPAYLSSTFILRGARPDAVILQHAPARRMLGDFPERSHADAAERDRPAPRLCRRRGHRSHHQPRGHDRCGGERGHHPVRARTGHPGHGCADATRHAARRHGRERLPGARCEARA